MKRWLLPITAAALAVGPARGAQMPRKVDLLVSGGTVVTVDAARRVIADGAVAISNGEILAVDESKTVAGRFTAVTTLDARGRIVLPGLINTHTHAPMVLYRGLADDLALMDWLQKYIFPAEAKTVSPEFVRVGTRLAALEMIRSGTTAYADMYYFEEEIARETAAAGLRGVLGQTIIQFPAPDAKMPADGLARAERFIREFQDHRLIVPAVAPHAAFTLDEQSLRACRALADRYGVPMLTHLAETKDEVAMVAEKHGGASPAAYLESIGFWSPATLAAHAVWLSDADIATLKRRGVGLSHNPESNMKLASGTAAVPKWLAAGIDAGLGTDGAASNNDLDMFEAMRQAAFLHKLATGDPRAIPAPVALEMATIGGARALGLEKRIGSLEAGKRADLIIVSLDGPRQTPMYDPVSHLVYVARGQDVETVLVDGRVLLEGRRIKTIDEPAALSAARAMADRVRAAVAR